MRYRVQYFLLAMLALPVPGQPQDPVRIVFRPEAVQRRYVEEVLKQGLPLGMQTINGIYSEPIVELGILVRMQPWVVPILEQRAQELLMNPVANKVQIDRIARRIIRSGSQNGLSSLTRLFGNHPDGSKWIRGFIFIVLDEPNYVNLWYSAIDSPNQIVREEAARCMPIIADNALERRMRDWADAAVDRYHHAPTEEEIMSDPIYGLPRSKELKVEQILRLKALGEEEVEETEEKERREQKGG